MASDNLIISVVIPLYNKDKYIKRTLDSVLAQTFKDFEVIVVNDGSTDSGPEIVTQYNDPRVRLIAQENGGASAARNHGIQEAQTELVAFLDADDEWLPEYLKTIILLYNKYPQAGAYATAYKLVDNKTSKIIGMSKNEEDFIINDYYLSSINRRIITSSSIVIKREATKKTGLFRVNVKRGEDLDMWFRLAFYYPIAYCKKPLAIYNLQCNNRMCVNSSPNLDYALYDSMLEISTILNKRKKRSIILCYNAYLLSSARELWHRGYKKIAIDKLKRYYIKHIASIPYLVFTVAYFACPSYLINIILKMKNIQIGDKL